MKSSGSEPGQSLMLGNGDVKFKLTKIQVKKNSRSNDRHVLARIQHLTFLLVNQNKFSSELYLLPVIKTSC